MNERDWSDALFHAEPDQWGLRGDPFLWSELHRAMRAHQVPSSSEALRELLESEIGALLGRPLDRVSIIHVERFAHGGMSSGQVCGEWWLETGIPLLLDRFRGTKA